MQGFIVIFALLLQLDGDIDTRIVPSQQITWWQFALSASYAQSYTFKLYIQEESGAKRTVILTNTLCGVTSGQIQCSTVLPIEANPAIISNNYSYMTATDPTSMIESVLSDPYIGDQGCIMRNNLYAIGTRITVTRNKGQLNSTYREFQAAKFKHIETKETGNNRYSILEECVGFIVTGPVTGSIQ